MPKAMISGVLTLSIVMSDLFLGSAWAQEAGAGGPPPGFGGLFGRMMPMFILVFLIFYFMVMKPQQQKMKEHSALLSGLKAGDMVVTSGGIIGRVSRSESDYVLLEVANNVKIKVEPSHVLKKVEKSSGEKASE